VTRRTLRTNLRFLARAVVPHLVPADLPLPRERAKAPCTPAEIGGFLALAAAQPTPARAMRAAALVCLGAGAGLIRSDLRAVRGTDICRRSGGVIMTVRGGRAPRAVPVLPGSLGEGPSGGRRSRRDPPRLGPGQPRCVPPVSRHFVE